MLLNLTIYVIVYVDLANMFGFALIHSIEIKQVHKIIFYVLLNANTTYWRANLKLFSLFMYYYDKQNHV